jgi:hypothetical protein
MRPAHKISPAVSTVRTAMRDQDIGIGLRYRPGRLFSVHLCDVQIGQGHLLTPLAPLDDHLVGVAVIPCSSPGQQVHRALPRG